MSDIPSEHSAPFSIIGGKQQILGVLFPYPPAINISWTAIVHDVRETAKHRTATDMDEHDARLLAKSKKRKTRIVKRNGSLNLLQMST